MKVKLIFFIGLFLSLSGHAQTQTGKASFYADRFSGRLTANGERFNPKKFTAAHRHLPFDTKVLVTNLANNKSVVVRINDRGPYVSGRIIDLSHAAAKKLGFIKKGVTDVVIKVVDENTVVDGKLIENTKDLVATSSKTRRKSKKQSKRVEKNAKKQAEQAEEAPTTKKVKTDSAIVEATEFYTLQTERSKPKGYGVQIGTFEEGINFLRLASRLTGQYQKRLTAEVKRVNETQVYSIIIGDFSSKDKAEEFKEEVRKDYPGAFIVNFSETKKTLSSDE